LILVYKIVFGLLGATSEAFFYSQSPTIARTSIYTK